MTQLLIPPPLALSRPAGYAQTISTQATGPACLIQSTFGAPGYPGNLELVVPEGNNLVGYWRDSSAAGSPWRPAGIISTHATGAACMIQSTLGTPSHPGDFELVVPEGNNLVSYWRDNAPTSLLWHQGATISTHATGPACLIQTTFAGSPGAPGNFELVVPEGNNLVSYWRDNSVPSFPWHQGATISTHATGAACFIQSTFTGSPGSPGNFELVVPEGNNLMSYWRDNSAAGLPWHPAGTISTHATGAACLIQSTLGTPSHLGNFELVVPEGNNLVSYWRDNAPTSLLWHQAATVSTRVTGPACLIQSTFGTVYGPIRDRWLALGGQSGPLGLPMTDVRDGPNGSRYANFEYGTIYWTAATGTREVIFQDRGFAAAEQAAARTGALDRNGMLAVFQYAAAQGTVSAALFHDLKSLIASSGTLTLPPDVTNLANKVVNGDPATVGLVSGDFANMSYHYLDGSGNVQTSALGELHVGSTGTQLTLLVNKWFLGINYPASASAHSYQPISTNVPLTDNGFNHYDVQQGAVGDCWLMASLAEVAARAPGYLQGMFTYAGTNTVNGATVGVWTVRFFRSNGSVSYVTVDTELPDGGSYYDGIWHWIPGGTNAIELWAALAEKAYAVENESGWIGTSSKAVNSYAALSGGWPSWALAALTGLSTTDLPNFAITQATLASAWNSGKLICLCTDSPSDPEIVAHHCYALVGYTPSVTASFTLYNPWGFQGGYQDGHFKLGQFAASATFLSGNFNLATVGGAIRSGQQVLVSSTPASLGQRAEAGQPAASLPAEANQRTDSDTAFATMRHHLEDSLRALSAPPAGHNKHPHEGMDQLFAKAEGDAWWRAEWSTARG